MIDRKLGDLFAGRDHEGSRWRAEGEAAGEYDVAIQTDRPLSKRIRRLLDLPASAFFARGSETDLRKTEQYAVATRIDPSYALGVGRVVAR